MANQSPGYNLFRDGAGFDTSFLPEPYKTWAKASTDPATFSKHNTSKQRSTLNRYTIQALLDYCDPQNADIGVTRIADGSYASEWLRPDGNTLFAYATKGGVLNACLRDPNSGRVSAIPNLGSSSQSFNTASILILYLLIAADINAASPDTQVITHELLDDLRSYFAANNELPETQTRLVCDDLYYSLSYGTIPATIRAGGVSLLTDRRLASNELTTGTLICGHPDYLLGASAAGSGMSSGRQTVKDAKALAESYTSNLHWTPDEEMLIPQFDDDTEVPTEVMTILTRFLSSREWANPMNNPCWRGITAYGKSTGVKILACILHTPLLWMTCATTTEVEDFLSKHVPNTDPEPILSDAASLPSFEDIVNDPAYAYEQLTGEKKDDATGDEVLQLYVKAASKDAPKKAETKNPFKIVESDFVRALVKGYIVEVQEFSRIRDSGTLVGLNNFSDPNSVIPLVDGRHVRRHPNAMVVWTDNVGYQSCRKVDGSVLRRMSYIIDSYSMSKDRALRRVKKNTGCKDDKLLDSMYDVWEEIGKYCKDNDITDEGTVSLTELESWVSLTLLDGKENIVNTCRQAVIAKVSSDPDTQEELMDSCVSVQLAKARLTE